MQALRKKVCPMFKWRTSGRNAAGPSGGNISDPVELSSSPDEMRARARAATAGGVVTVSKLLTYSSQRLELQYAEEWAAHHWLRSAIWSAALSVVSLGFWYTTAGLWYKTKEDKTNAMVLGNTALSLHRVVPVLLLAALGRQWYIKHLQYIMIVLRVMRAAMWLHLWAINLEPWSCPHIQAALMEAWVASLIWPFAFPLLFRDHLVPHTLMVASICCAAAAPHKGICAALQQGSSGDRHLAAVCTQVLSNQTRMWSWINAIMTLGTWDVRGGRVTDVGCRPLMLYALTGLGLLLPMLLVYAQELRHRRQWLAGGGSAEGSMDQRQGGECPTAGGAGGPSPGPNAVQPALGRITQGQLQRSIRFLQVGSELEFIVYLGASLLVSLWALLSIGVSCAALLPRS